MNIICITGALSVHMYIYIAFKCCVHIRLKHKDSFNAVTHEYFLYFLHFSEPIIGCQLVSIFILLRYIFSSEI